MPINNCKCPKKVIPPVPASLEADPVARETWVKLMNRLKTGSYHSRDALHMAKFERYCSYVSIYTAARSDVAANGPFLKASNGIAYRNPAFTVMNQAQSHLMKLEKGLDRLLEDEPEWE
jgi:P27 family predicted phage terminase small subunit